MLTESESSRSLKFRMATREDTSQIVGLLNLGFRTPMDAATWEWYAYGNPSGPSRVYLAFDSSETAVGVIGFAPLRLRLSGKTRNGDYAHHLVLAHTHRDTFSYLSILRHSLQGEAARNVELIIGPPNRTAYPIHKTLMKWVDFGYLDCMRKMTPATRPHSCEEVWTFPEQFDRFYASASRELQFCVAKTKEWMNWRFFSRPGAPYTIYVSASGNDWSGYIILKRWQDPDGYRKAHIIDLHAGNDAALSNLIAAAESYADGCNELNLWAIQGYPYRRALEGMGFGDYGRQPLLARTFDGKAPQYPDGACSLMYGDGDTLY